MTKSTKKLIFLLFFGAGMLLFTSCKTSEGCGLEDKYAVDLETKKRGKTKLFKNTKAKKRKNEEQPK